MTLIHTIASLRISADKAELLGFATVAASIRGSANELAKMLIPTTPCPDYWAPKYCSVREPNRAASATTKYFGG
jgi:hypothetical protein